MYTPKISIILPVFNGERYLNESIDSVLAQEYRDYELLICDDVSTDNTASIIESKQDTRIKFFKYRVRQGLFKSLNMLISQSRGEYIRIWTHDDIMKPHCLKEEIEFYKNHPEIGFCYCACDTIDDSGKTVFRALEGKTPDIIPPKLAAQIMVYHGSIMAAISNVMIKKNILDDVGLFREDMQLAGDFEMWVRISKKYPIGFIRQPLIYLRVHSGQLAYTKGHGLIMLQERKEILAALMENLPSEIVDYAKVYRLWHSRIQYTSYMTRSLLFGHFKIAREMYKEIRQIANPFFAIGMWLITMNGRFFKKKPRFGGPITKN